MDEFNNNQSQPQDPWTQPEQPAQEPVPQSAEPAPNAYSYGEPTTQESAPQDYYYQGTVEVAPAKKVSGLAIGSMICGILAVLGGCLSCMPLFAVLQLLVAVAGLVMGIINNKKQLGGKGMAIAGIICSGIAIAFAIICLVLNIIGTVALKDPAFAEEFYKQYGDIIEQYSIAVFH